MENCYHFYLQKINLITNHISNNLSSVYERPAKLKLNNIADEYVQCQVSSNNVDEYLQCQFSNNIADEHGQSQVINNIVDEYVQWRVTNNMWMNTVQTGEKCTLRLLMYVFKF